jgi:sterol desaturase/sphingolipid hydroxylase (fatty acid hydroxylase superfamily)
MPWSIICVGACFIVFGLLSLRFPCNRSQPKFVSRESADDLLYYFVSVLFYTGLTMALATWLARSFGGAAATRAVHDGYGWLARLPLIVQVLIVFLVTDFCQYWTHRLFHARGLWPFHAVHHSARNVDWSTTFRVHPVNSLVHSTGVAVLTQLMGFSPLVFVIIAPVNLFLGALVHANLDWTFGPFRYVLASPVFHRWHHSRDPEVRDKNFAPTFPLLDLMFGTFHMPEGRLPEDYGADEVPDHFLGQMIHPFRPWLDRLPGSKSRPAASGPGLSPG